METRLVKIAADPLVLDGNSLPPYTRKPKSSYRHSKSRSDWLRTNIMLKWNMQNLLIREVDGTVLARSGDCVGAIADAFARAGSNQIGEAFDLIGFTNWEEYLAGTNPQASNSHPTGLLTIPNSWALYTATNQVEVTADIRSTNAWVKVKAAEYFLDSTNGVVNGTGNAMSATNGAFNSTNIIAKATFTPSFPYGERHELFVHAQGQDNQWCPFVKVILNPNVNDILDKIQANYSAFADLQYNVTAIEYNDNVTVRTNSATVKWKGPYKMWSQNDAGFVAIRNENRTWWYNDALDVGGAMTKGINGDSTVEGSRVSDFFWDVPLSKTRTDASISNSVNSASFNCLQSPKTGVLWPVLNFGTDYTHGFVTQMGGKTADVAMKSEYLNPVEVFPGHWLFTVHRQTLQFDSGEQIVVESTIGNIQVNQGLTDDLFIIPEEE